MNVTREEFQNMKEEIVKDMIAFRMEDSGCTMQESFNEVYRSKIFEKLCDPDSGLFFQASRYVYAYLLEELRANLKSAFPWAAGVGQVKKVCKTNGK